MATRRYGITVLHVVLLCNLTDSGQFVWWCLLHQVGHNKGENRKQTLMTSTSSPVLQWKHVSMYVPVQQWQFHIQTTHTHTHTHRLTHKHTHTRTRIHTGWRTNTETPTGTQKGLSVSRWRRAGSWPIKGGRLPREPSCTCVSRQ